MFVLTLLITLLIGSINTESYSFSLKKSLAIQNRNSPISDSFVYNNNNNLLLTFSSNQQPIGVTISDQAVPSYNFSNNVPAVYVLNAGIDENNENVMILYGDGAVRIYRKDGDFLSTINAQNGYIFKKMLLTNNNLTMFVQYKTNQPYRITTSSLSSPFMTNFRMTLPFLPNQQIKYLISDSTNTHIAVSSSTKIVIFHLWTGTLISSIQMNPNTFVKDIALSDGHFLAFSVDNLTVCLYKYENEVGKYLYLECFGGGPRQAMPSRVKYYGESLVYTCDDVVKIRQKYNSFNTNANNNQVQVPDSFRVNNSTTKITNIQAYPEDNTIILGLQNGSIYIVIITSNGTSPTYIQKRTDTINVPFLVVVAIVASVTIIVVVIIIIILVAVCKKSTTVSVVNFRTVLPEQSSTISVETDCTRDKDKIKVRSTSWWARR